MSFLDKLAYKSTQALLISGIVLWLLIIAAALYSVLTEDPIIGYTEHGIPVLKSEVENNE